jgi:hypothetical protein
MILIEILWEEEEEPLCRYSKNFNLINLILRIYYALWFWQKLLFKEIVSRNFVVWFLVIFAFLHIRIGFFFALKIHSFSYQIFWLCLGVVSPKAYICPSTDGLIMCLFTKNAKNVKKYALNFENAKILIAPE